MDRNLKVPASYGRRPSVVFAVILVASNILVFQLATMKKVNSATDSASLRADAVSQLSLSAAAAVQAQPASQSQNASSPPHAGGGIHGVGIPAGGAQALPSIRTSEAEEASIGIKRKIYGGKGDKAHLGGFTDIDLHGISPTLWKYLVQHLGVKSILDIGCGKGVSSSWFAYHGLEVLCAEGSHDAVTQSILPDPATQVVEHDFSRGPWWPSKTYDAVWCVEFTEHVGRNFQQNYVTAFRKAAFIFVTHSGWGGWHHVEVHDDDWWQMRFESYGFVFSKILTDKARGVAGEEMRSGTPSPVEGQNYNAQHLRINLQVFINPSVASLPEHQHLLAEHGCYGGKNDKGRIHIECGGENDKEKLTALPASYQPLALDSEMDTKWENMIKGVLQKGDRKSVV